MDGFFFHYFFYLEIFALFSCYNHPPPTIFFQHLFFIYPYPQSFYFHYLFFKSIFYFRMNDFGFFFQNSDATKASAPRLVSLLSSNHRKVWNCLQSKEKQQRKMMNKNKKKKKTFNDSFFYLMVMRKKFWEEKKRWDE